MRFIFRPVSLVVASNYTSSASTPYRCHNLLNYSTRKTSVITLARNFHHKALGRVASSLKETKLEQIMDAAVPCDKFPVCDLLPKKETTAASFIQKYPEFDGRGVKIAIFDSGVDPGAPGLQTTTDGKPKIIAMMDGSGAGDVDTSKTVKLEEDGTITGLSGRKLTIPKSWKNPSGEFHVGLKPAFDLYNTCLEKRIKTEYRDKVWNPSHAKAKVEALRKLNEFNDKVKKTSAKSEVNLNNDQKLEMEELQAAVDNLNQLEQKYTDLGPSYDCVVFHDGEMWRAAIDTTETGDLEKATLLGPYSKTLKYATLTDGDRLNYSVNIHENGNLLEIVSMCSSHGTHVAAISAAHFPSEPERNGVAPGAQIVSICIGYNPLGSMETGIAMTRAIIKAIELGVDVINMSYGEFTHFLSGRVLEHFSSLVTRHGVIFVTSAGNHGPALSTTGAPGTLPDFIGVGAYVTPEMQVAEYSMRGKVPATSYTWTSRGPTLQGDLGVTIAAPGGAITSVPNFALQCTQMMNGTSMASPNAAGGVALLVSGLKQSNIKYSPFSVRRSIENTALKVPSYDVFAMGHGVIQIEKAYEHLSTYTDQVDRDVRFAINVDEEMKGVILRTTTGNNKPTTYAVTIEPIYLNDKHRNNDEKINFSINLNLVCDASWVESPSHFHLSYTKRGFVIKVNPAGLTSGVHYTSLRAYDAASVNRGAIFHIPVTCIVSAPASELSTPEKFTLKPGSLIRKFVQVPTGATIAAITFTNHSSTEDSQLCFHTTQVTPHKFIKHFEKEKFFKLDPQKTETVYFPVLENQPLEVTFGKWWSCLNTIDCSMDVKFHGLKPNNPDITMALSEGLHRVDVTSPLGHEELHPGVALRHLVVPLKPADHKILPMGSERDLLPDNRQLHKNLLTYNFTLSKPSEVCLKSPLLSDYLYESEYETQIWMLYDSNKRHYLTGDAYSNKYVKLEKGDYTIQMHVVHENVSMLEKVNELILCLWHKLPSDTPITLDVYPSIKAGLTGSAKFKPKSLSPQTVSSPVPLYVSSVSSEKLLKSIPCVTSLTPGSYLSGSITYFKPELKRKAEKFPFNLVIDFNGKSDSKDDNKESGSVENSPSKKNSNESSATSANEKKENDEAEKDKELVEQYNEALLKLKSTWISKVKPGLELHEQLVKESGSITVKSEKENEKLATINLAIITALENEKDAEKRNHKEIVRLANEVIKSIDLTKLLGSLAVSKVDKKDGTKDLVNHHKSLEKEKSNFMEALVAKGSAICDWLELKNTGLPTSTTGSTKSPSKAAAVVSQSDEFNLEQADKIYFELAKLTDGDMFDKKVVKFTEKHALVRKDYARLVKVLFKIQENGKSSSENENKLIETFGKIPEWDHCHRFYKRNFNAKFPKSYKNI